MTKIIVAECKNFVGLCLEGIECPIDYNKQDDDGTLGFLDPLLHASSSYLQCDSRRQCNLAITAQTQPAHSSSLVSTNAVHALFAEIAETVLFKNHTVQELHLCGLGLNNSHCVAISEALQTGIIIEQDPHMGMRELNLERNPQINAKGYCTLLSLINQTDAFQYLKVDEKTWQGRLNLVAEMNCYHDRRQYLTEDGIFASRKMEVAVVPKVGLSSK